MNLTRLTTVDNQADASPEAGGKQVMMDSAHRHQCWDWRAAGIDGSVAQDQNGYTFPAGCFRGLDQL
jgi:hypothetical protein